MTHIDFASYVGQERKDWMMIQIESLHGATISEIVPSSLDSPERVAAVSALWKEGAVTVGYSNSTTAKMAGPSIVGLGGNVVFVGCHLLRAFHPLKAQTGFLFDRRMPFAETVWRRKVRDSARGLERFKWPKEAYFAGLVRKVVTCTRGLAEQITRAA